MIRYLWAGPNTLLGLIVAPVALIGGRVRVERGVVELDGPAVAWLLRRLIPLKGGALALTVGHVVLARDERAMARCRTHERVHVRQYERWGPLFIPAYVLASIVAFLQGRHYYLDNIFEREARLEEERIYGRTPLNVAMARQTSRR